MALDIAAACHLASSALAELADPVKAEGMAAYMKTDMPFYGVPKPGRTPILRRLRSQHIPATAGEYASLVSALWGLPHREEKYLALGVAAAHPAFVEPSALRLYRRLIVEGAWWDLVDETAHLVGRLVRDFPVEAWPEVERWVDDPDMWLRRTALICQVGAKDRTDAARLFRFCLRRMDEKEFFIRKAIGWALRDYARTDPEAVAEFALRHRHEMSGLSFREATKHLGHLA